MSVTAASSPRALPRFPAIPRARGHYESFYLRATHPTEPIALWVRYTVHQRPGAAPTAALWCTLFAADEDAPRACKQSFDPAALRPGPPGYVRVGDAHLGADGAVGAAAAGGHRAAWNLSYASAEEPLEHLPRAWMYRAPVPRTKLESPHPAATFSGWIEVDGRREAVDGWPGMVGHNWGAEHAERWIWLHGTAFADQPDAWLDVAIGRIRVGRLTTPWIANGVVCVEGRRHRLGGVERVRATRVVETPTECGFVLPGADLEVRGNVRAPRGAFAGWVYSDPGGGEHHVLNCSRAALSAGVDFRSRPPVALATEHGGAYELGLRERDHGIPILPFPDP